MKLEHLEWKVCLDSLEFIQVLDKKYIPQDKDQVAFYKEGYKGQVLQEGINELGAMSSWIAAATSYSVNNYPMIPFLYILLNVWVPKNWRFMLGSR